MDKPIKAYLVRLEPKTHKKLKIFAAKQGISMTKAVTQLLYEKSK